MKYFYILFFLSFSCFSYSQNQIDGKIIDKDNEALIGATVVLLDQVDSTMVAFGITNGQGQFRLNDIAPSDYLIQVSYISYASHQSNLDIEWNSKKIVLDPITLLESSVVLQEIEVSAEHIPMGIRGDTISYNASAFKTRPGATVEDLLKKLPGIEVERNGNIKAHGEDVENILVDGKEFFGSDLTMATKNLEAEAVDKVDVYDKKSDIAEFTGIDDGQEEKTINLQLKEGHKKGGFGNINVAGGTEESYDTKLNYFRFSPAMQASTIFSANNVNKETFSINDRIDFMGGIGNAMSGGGLNISRYQGLGDGLNSSLSAGLNFNYDFSGKLELRSHYIYNKTSNLLAQFNDVSTFTEDFDFLKMDTIHSDNKNNEHQANTKLEYKVNPLTEIILKNNFNFGAKDRLSNSDAAYIQNAIFSGNTSSRFEDLQDNFTYESKALLKRKFEKTGRSLIASLSYINALNNSFNAIDNLNQVGVNHIHLIQDQEFRNKKNQFTGSVNYTEPLMKKLFLGLNYRYGHSEERPYRDYYDISDDQRTLNTALTANYLKTYVYNLAGVSIRRNTKKVKMNLGLQAQKTSLSGELSNQEQPVDGNYYHLLPNFNLNYEIGGGRSLDLNYFTNVNAPELEQLMPFTNNTNPNFEMLGNPELTPEYNHQLRLGFNYFDNFSFTNFWSSLDFQYAEDRIVYKTNIDENLFQTIVPVNTDQYWGINSHVSFSKPFRPLHLNYRIRARLRYANYDSYINDLESNVQDNNFNLRLSVTNRKTDYVSIESGISLNLDSKRYALNDAFNQDYYSTDFFIDGEAYLPKGWTIASELIYRRFSEASFSDNPSYVLWSSSISKFFLKDRLEIRLSANDLLNENIGYKRSSTSNSLSQSYSNSLGRYFMLGAHYRIGKTQDNGGIRIEID